MLTSLRFPLTLCIFKSTMEEIIIDVENAFSADPNIDEVGFVFEIPPEDAFGSSKSVLLIDHKLGINAKHLKTLYIYALNMMKDSIQLFGSGHTAPQSSEGLGMNVLKTLLSTSRIVLLIQPNMPMALNVRKQLLVDTIRTCTNISKAMGELEKEVLLLDILLLKSPKSPSLWQHRKWCISQLIMFFDARIQQKQCNLSNYVVSIGKASGYYLYSNGFQKLLS